MATSPRTLDQVRSILGKLDRRIDALREARTTDGPLPGQGAAPRAMQLIGGSVSASPLAPTPGASAMDGSQLIGGPSRFVSPPQTESAPVNPNRSLYGRATPLRHAQ